MASLKSIALIFPRKAVAFQPAMVNTNSAAIVKSLIFLRL